MAMGEHLYCETRWQTEAVTVNTMPYIVLDPRHLRAAVLSRERVVGLHTCPTCPYMSPYNPLSPSWKTFRSRTSA